MLGVQLDPQPLLDDFDPDYLLIYGIVVDKATELHNKLHGG